LKAIEQNFHVVLFIMLLVVLLATEAVFKTLSVAIQMKVTGQYFLLVLFVMLYKVTLRPVSI